jgi:hypothetical protein
LLLGQEGIEQLLDHVLVLVGQLLDFLKLLQQSPVLEAADVGVVRPGPMPRLGPRQILVLRKSRRRCARPSGVSAISSTPATKTLFDGAMVPDWKNAGNACKLGKRALTLHVVNHPPLDPQVTCR